MSAFRYDIGALQPVKRLPDGRLVAEGHLTRAGVFEYLNADGSVRRELRLPEDVFREDSLASFSMAPVTDDHPPELLTAKNARQYAIGTVGESIRRDEDFMRARLTVFDADTIHKMESGKVALSCGYEVDLDETPGNHPVYGRYDAIQRNIRGNHVAIVDSARAGNSARVRMDGAAVQVASVRENNSMATLEIALEQLAAEKVRADNAEKVRDEEKTRADKAEGALESAKIELSNIKKVRADEEDPTKLTDTIRGLTAKLSEEKARADRAENPDRLRKAVENRVKVEGAAVAVLGGRYDVSKYTDRELMTAVVEKLHGQGIASDASDDYARARFDAAVEGFQAGELALASLRAAVKAEEQPRQDARSAREAMIKRNQNAWQKGA